MAVSLLRARFFFSRASDELGVLIKIAQHQILRQLVEQCERFTAVSRKLATPVQTERRRAPKVRIGGGSKDEFIWMADGRRSLVAL